MSFLVSPGVQVKEIDLTNVIPAVSTSIGGFSGQFAWGPVDQIVELSSEKELVSIFGKPNAAPLTAVSFHTAASFLKYANSLKIVRNISQARNAYCGDLVIDGVVVKNQSHFESQALNPAFIAKYPGSLGNSIAIYIFIADDNSALASQFDNFALESGEAHVLIVDSDGKISGTAGTVLEKYEFINTTDRTAKKADGSSNYLKDVLNRSSSFVWATGENYDDGDTGVDFDSSGNVVITLSRGDDDQVSVVPDYSLFGDAETVDVNLIIGGFCEQTKANNLIALAEARRDVVVFISPPAEDTVNINPIEATTNVVNRINNFTSSSYAVFDSTAVYTYDKYNDSYVWIPASGHTAGLCARTDANAEPWFSPAGFNRGNLMGVTKIAFNPNQAQRDALYKARVNPIVSFPGQGILLYGDKTGLSKPSAFDRINVRRLFIILQKAIATAAKYQLFELNDEFTRAVFRNMTEPFLRDVQARRGITDFLVVCDETNNTGEVIDTNRFVADIYIKPARSINFISLNFIATRTGVEFSEIVGL